MLVSWNWLKDYVQLDMPPAEVERRLMMSGLNHEGTVAVEDDLAIDLEVTSNRPDCLGHLGVAREIAVLFDRSLRSPDPRPTAGREAVEDQVKIQIHCSDLCYRYSGRVVRGVQVGPSPRWLAERLQTAGVATVNNVVDITNYVLFECGQPLHAFDLGRLAGPEINVREAVRGEEFLAIDHRTYLLEPGMCVIADAQRAVALGGVMGGADTEVSAATTDLLIEAAEFSPLAIRGTARKLNLHSPSSYRFERGLDPEGVDWASRRCCQLILELAGGELAEGVVDVGRKVAPRPPVTVRFAQLERILGIRVPEDEVKRILAALGNQLLDQRPDELEVYPPSWRRDLTREIDLVEEVARIHGYDKIPEDVAVPMWPSHQDDRERVVDTIRRVLTAGGFDEAVTASLVPTQWSQAFSPWTNADPIKSTTPMKGILADAPKELSQAELIRRSLIPSLLEARRYNESVSNPVAELFEIAKVYLPNGSDLPQEQWTLGIVSGFDFSRLKGVVEDLLAALHSQTTLSIRAATHSFLDKRFACELWLGDERLGFLGLVSDQSLRQFGVRSATAIAELRVDRLRQSANLIPQYSVPSPYPLVARDLNLIVSESLQWAALAQTVAEAGGELLEELSYQETYRDPKRDGAGKKRLLFSFTLRADDRTLTNEDADKIRDGIVAACRRKHGAELVA